MVFERLDAAVVTREYDERVAALAGFVERGDEAADRRVELRDHRGQSQPRVVLGGVVVEADAVVQPLELVRRINRRVHRVEGNVEEPGFAVAGRCGNSAVANPPLGLRRDQLGGVALLVEADAVAMPGVFVGAATVLVGPGVGCAGKRPVGVVEAIGVWAPLRPRAQVPLAGLVGGVAKRLQGRGERDGAWRQGAEVARVNRLRSKTAGVAAGHEGRPRGRADWLHVVAVELHPLADEAIHVGRLAEAAVPSDIAPAEVIGHDDEDVWPWRLRGEPEARASDRRQCKEEARRVKLCHKRPHTGGSVDTRASCVQAQRREAWGELPPDAASSVVRPRPHGRSAFTRRAHVLRMNRMKEGTHDTPTTHSTRVQLSVSRGYASG